MNKPNMVNRGIAVRIATSLVGGIINIYLATFLIDNLGHDYFATYVLITSLPLLMLWADFGLGSLILNTFIDVQRNLLNSEIVRQRINFAFYFILTIGFLSLLFFITLLKLWESAIDKSDSFSRMSTLSISVLGITSLAVPFSLGARKFQADNEYLRVIKIQGLIPFSIALITFISAKSLPSNTGFLILVPSLVYLSNTLIIFLKSGLGSYITLPRATYFNRNFFQYIRLGFWSLILTTMIGVTFQLPKYILAMFKSNLDVAGYGLQSLLIIPGISFLAIPTIMTIPRFREANQSREIGEVYTSTLTKTRLLATLLAFLTILIIPFQTFLHINRLTLSEILQVSLLFIFAPSWIVPALMVTEMQDIREVARRFVSVMFLALVFTYIIRNSDAFWILSGYFTIIYLGYTISIPYKNDFAINESSQ